MAAPVLAGYTLANVMEGGYRVYPHFRGATRRLATGTPQTDLVDATLKYRFELSWRLLTDAQKTAIINAYTAIKSASAAFTGPDGTAATVVRDPSQKELRFDHSTAAGGANRWAVTLLLEEV